MGDFNDLNDVEGIINEALRQVELKDEELHEIKNELEDSRGLNAELHDELERQQNLNKTLEEKQQEIDKNSFKNDQTNRKLERDIARLKRELENAKEEVHKQREARKIQQTVTSKQRLDQREHLVILQENKQLSDEIIELTNLAETLSGAIQVHERESESYKQTIEECHNSIEDLKNNKMKLEAEVEELKNDLENKRLALSEANRREVELQNAMEEINRDTASRLELAESNSEELRKHVAKLEKVNGELRENSAVPELSIRIEKLEKDLAVEALVGSDAVEALERCQDELGIVKEELSHLKNEVGDTVARAVEKERARIPALEGQVKNQMDLVAQERERVQAIEKEKASVEQQVLECLAWMKKYEEGYSLTDAMAEVRRLKEFIHLRDMDIQNLTTSLSEKIQTLDKMGTVVCMLKERCGLESADTEDIFGDKDFHDGIESEVGRLRALVAELERQNDMLMETQVKLLSEARVQTQLMSDKGIKFFGLDGQQMRLVNEFAESLRRGTAELPLDNRSLALNKDVERLKNDNEKLRNDLAATKVLAEERASVQERPFQELESRSKEISELQKINGDLREELAKFKTEGTFLREQIANTNKRLEHEIESRNQIESQLVLPIVDAKMAPSTPLANKRVEGMIDNLHKQMEVMASQRVKSPVKQQSGLKQIQREYETVFSENQLLKSQLIDEQNKCTSLAKTNDSLQLQISELRQSKIRPIDVSHEAVHGDQTKLKDKPHVASSLYERKFKNISVHESNEQHEKSPFKCFAALHDTVSALMKRTSEVKSLRCFADSCGRKLKTIAAQQVLLYHEQSKAIRIHKATIKAIRVKLDKSRDEVSEFRSKALSYDRLIEESSDDDKQRMLKDLTIAEINNQVLSRKYNVQAEELIELRKRFNILAEDSAESDALSAKRILYLEQWKLRAVGELAELHENMTKTVPEACFMELRKRLQVIHNKFIAQLDTESVYCGELSHLRKKVADLESIKAELKFSQKELKAAISKLRIIKTSKGAPCQEEKKLEQNVVEEKLKIESEKSRVLEVKLKQSIERVCELELSLNNVKKEANRNTLTTNQQVRREKPSGENQEQLVQLREKIDRQTNLAEIASDQISVLTSLCHSKDEEIESLREWLLNQSEKSDSNAIIGKLQQQILALKSSYSQFVRKHNLAKLNLTRQSLQLRHCEAELDKALSKTQQIQAREHSNVLVWQESSYELLMKLCQTVPASKVEHMLKENERVCQQQQLAMDEQRQKYEMMLSESHGKIDDLEKQLEILQLEGGIFEFDSLRGIELESRPQVEEQLSLSMPVADQTNDHSSSNKNNVGIVDQENHTTLLKRLEISDKQILEYLEDIAKLKETIRTLQYKLDLQDVKLQSGNKSITRKTDLQASEVRSEELFEQDQRRLTEAAQSTIDNLKSLIEKKNQLVDHYRKELKELQLSFEVERRAEYAELDLERSQIERSHQEQVDKLHCALASLSDVPSKAIFESNAKLLRQLENAEKSERLKEREIRRLEAELSNSQNQIVLTEQKLNNEQELLSELNMKFENVADELIVCKKNHNVELSSNQKQLAIKDSRINKMRNQIVSLKSEFITSSENCEKDKEELQRRLQNAEVIIAGLNKSLRATQSSDSKVMHKNSTDVMEKVKVDAICDQLKDQIKASKKRTENGRSYIVKLKAKIASDGRKYTLLEKSLHDSQQLVKQLQSELSSERRLCSEQDKELESASRISRKAKKLQNELASANATIVLLKTDLGKCSRDLDNEKHLVQALKGVAVSNDSRAGFLETKTEEDCHSHQIAKHYKKLANQNQVVRKQLEECRKELTRIKSDMSIVNDQRGKLQKQVNNLNNRLKDFETLKNVVSSLTNTEALRQRVFELEDISAQQQLAEVQLKSNIRRLEDQCQLAEQEKHEKIRENGKLEEQNNLLQKRMFVKAESGDAITEDEQRYLENLELKRHIKDLKSDIYSLKSKLKSASNSALDHRFETDQARLESDSLRRRLSEMTTIEELSRMMESNIRKGSPQKQETDLQVVVNTLKRVTDKLQKENTRLRSEISRSHTALSHLRVSLDDCKAEKQSIFQSFEALKTEYGALEKRTFVAQKKIGETQTIISSEQISLKDNLLERYSLEVRALKTEVKKQSHEITELRDNKTQNQLELDSEIERLKSENKKLVADNIQYRHELIEFDESFFENIENMKVKLKFQEDKLRNLQHSTST